MDSSELDGLCKGHPLVLDEGDGITSNVYFRSFRYSPHTGNAAVVVADEGGGLLAVEPSELSWREDI